MSIAPSQWPSWLTIVERGSHWILLDKEGNAIDRRVRFSTLTDDLRDAGYLPADVEHLIWSRPEAAEAAT